jgi:hypothetical protein
MSDDELRNMPEGLPNSDAPPPAQPKRSKKLNGGETPWARKTKRAEEPAKPQAEYAPSPEEADSSEPDPFDPKQFRAGSQTAASIAQRVWTDGQILIRKPNDQEWFRVRPGDDWTLMASILQRRADGKYRLLDPYGEGKWETTPSTFRDWLRIGFGKDGVIRDLEHPDLKKLRGEL